MGHLHESATGTANSTGRAVARLTPLRAFERWHVDNVSISSTSTTLVPEFELFIGGESPSNFHSGSSRGTRDSNPDKFTLENGQPLIGVWTGCDVGATCVLTIRGETSK